MNPVSHLVIAWSYNTCAVCSGQWAVQVGTKNSRWQAKSFVLSISQKLKFFITFNSFQIQIWVLQKIEFWAFLKLLSHCGQKKIWNVDSPDPNRYWRHTRRVTTAYKWRDPGQLVSHITLTISRLNMKSILVSKIPRLWSTLDHSGAWTAKLSCITLLWESIPLSILPAR